MKTLDDLLEKKELIQKICKSYTSVPNLFDVVRMNENAHTRVIHMLLNYRREKNPIFLRSFLSYVSDDFKQLSDEDFCNSIVNQQSDYIDCIIKVGKYSIIIENKIHGAVDQNGQLKSYISSVGEDENSVYVIYLTLTGGEPSHVSLPDKDKQKIGNRLVKLNYLNDILNWLESDVLAECKVKESLLVNSLRIYIDHLNGILGQKNHEKKLLDELKKLLKIEYTLEYYNSLHAVLTKVNSDSEKRESDLEKNEYFSTAIQMILREIEKQNPYVNEDRVAYTLKNMFNNIPPFIDKSSWVDDCVNIRPFIPRCFVGYNCRYLRLIGMDLQIHLQCSAINIKENGPYILLNPDEAEKRFGKENLESIGLVRKGFYSFPYTSFDQNKTRIIDVAFHIKKLVDGLKNLSHS